jgi:tetratricopeptide (TPR) repeat protein
MAEGIRSGSSVARRAILSLCAVCLLTAGCRSRPAAVRPAPAAVPEEVVRSWVSQGDTHAQGDFLTAWRLAEGFYARAYEATGGRDLKEKLRLIRFLIFTREIDEDIPQRDFEGRLDFLCRDVSTPRAQLLCQIARRYAQNSDPAPARIGPLDLAVSSSPQDAYLLALYVRAFALEIAEEPLDKFPDHPLYVYLNMARVLAARSAGLEERWPDFAELLVFAGERHFQGRRFKQARNSFRKALSLVPDYTRAWNGLGNIRLFSLEDPDGALAFYEAALQHDPDNPAALFGKGAALHEQENYAASSAVLDRVLETDFSRRPRTAERNARYFRGMGRYYRAYNDHQLHKPAAARSIIDAAKTDLPDSDLVNYLSGLIHYEAGQYEPARIDFERAVQSGTRNCHASFYLGVMALETSSELAESRFLGSCACIDSYIRTMTQYIQSVPSFDLEPQEQVVLQGRLEKKLVDFRLSSVELIQNMMRAMEHSKSEKKERTTDLMKHLLARVGPLQE